MRKDIHTNRKNVYNVNIEGLISCIHKEGFEIDIYIEMLDIYIESKIIHLILTPKSPKH